jgi:hypothetical protein
MNMLPIGTVVKAGDAKAMIVGYYSKTAENRFYNLYIICGYPMGYVNKKSIAAIPMDAEMEVVFEGYADEQFQQYKRNKQGMFETLDSVTVSEVNEQLECLEQLLEKRQEENVNG